MAHSHYVLDLYFSDERSGTRREVLRIPGANDDAAIGEGSRISGWRQPVRFEVRAIEKGARANHRVVYASVVTEPPTVGDSVDDGPAIVESGSDAVSPQKPDELT